MLARALGMWLLVVACFITLVEAAALARQSEPRETVEPPDSAVGRQLQWVLDVANGGEPGDAVGRMSDHFRTLFAPEELVRELRKVREQRFSNKRIRLIQVGEAGESALSGFVEGGGREMSVFIAIDDKTKQIDGLRFADAGYAFGDEGDAGGASWSDFDGQAGRLGGKLSFGAYEIVLDKKASTANPGLSPPPMMLKPIHTIHEDEALAIGSAAQLFVLHALADASLAGKIRWEEQLPFRERDSVFALGDLKTAKEGTAFSIEDWAKRMVTTGDAAASDTLVALLGRDTIQASYAKFAVSTKRTLPWLSTRECLHLKLAASDELRAGYIKSDEAARKAMLAEGDPGGLAKLDLTRELLKTWQEPRHIEEVGWFASAEDLCKLMMEFRRLEQLPGPVAPDGTAGASPLARVGTMLRQERGLEFEEEWASIAYKGGMEPGVVCMNWLFEREDGADEREVNPPPRAAAAPERGAKPPERIAHKWFVLSITWNNAKEPLELPRFAKLAQSGCTLLFNADRPKPPAPPRPKATPEDPNADGK